VLLGVRRTWDDKSFHDLFEREGAHVLLLDQVDDLVSQIDLPLEARPSVGVGGSRLQQLVVALEI
jgi:carbamoylphosphate synthase large subunit